MIKNLLQLFVINRTYWVFRRFSDRGEAFALHFVEPYKSRRKAQKDIDNAKLMQPDQEFIILRG